MGARAAIAAVLLSAACTEADEGTGAGGAGGSAGAGGADATTTWWEHVAPIVYDNCLGCHTDGGIAPYPLVAYENARPVATVMKTQTADRTMPPWHADNSSSCQTYADARWLTDEQIATIGAWA